MSRTTAGNAFAALAILGCLGALTALAFVAIRHFGLQSGLSEFAVGIGLVVLGTLLVRAVLVAVDDWAERAERPGLPRGRRRP